MTFRVRGNKVLATMHQSTAIIWHFIHVHISLVDYTILGLIIIYYNYARTKSPYLSILIRH